MAILDLSRPPAPWSIIEGQSEADDMLRLGQRLVRVADIVRVDTGSVAELNYHGHMLAVGTFLGLGSLFVLPVVMALLEKKFLAGAALFAGIGLMLISDIWQGHSMTVHRVALGLSDGRTEVFASPEIEECQRLWAAMSARGLC